MLFKIAESPLWLMILVFDIFYENNNKLNSLQFIYNSLYIVYNIKQNILHFNDNS